jgi:DNA-binding NtrC family response regulator
MENLGNSFPNGSGLWEHLTKLASRTPLQEATFLLLRSQWNAASREEALRLARSIDVINSRDPDILFFVYYWAKVTNNHSERFACARLARSLASDVANANPLAMILLLEAESHSLLHDYSRFMSSGLEALQVARQALPHIHIHVTANLCLDFALLGQLAKLRDDVVQVWKNDPIRSIRRLFLLADLAEATEAFRINEANDILANFPQVAHLPDNHISLLLSSSTLLHTYCSIFPLQAPARLNTPVFPGRLQDVHERHAPKDDIYLPTCEREKCYRTISETLHRNRPKEALEAACTLIRTFGETLITSAGANGYFLIRTELANGNISAACRALNARNEAGLGHPIDAFFRARIALLQQHTENAHALFLKCVEDMDASHARNRLSFELALSCELPPAVMQEWSRILSEPPGSKKTPAGKVADPADADPPPPDSMPVSDWSRPVLSGVARLIGQSRDMERLRQFIRQIAGNDAPILITGQTGTGKEVAAWAIHEESPRKTQPYMAINCAALTESLLSSELFGHEKGAFTGASEKYQGLIRAAGNGTLFLDEIGEISTNMQASLLRVLETGEFRPVGSTRILAMRCRIIAATNRDLLKAVRDGRFREDLFYRLCRLAINIPPLKERKADILPIVHFFFNWDRANGSRVTFHADLENALVAHDWPGNVRELRNIVERIRLFHGDKTEYVLDDLLSVMPQWNSVHPSHAAERLTAPAVETSEPLRSNRIYAAPNLLSERSRLRIEDVMLQMFQKYGKLTRKELMGELRLASATATKYLQNLIQSGHIEKVEPSRSSRSHYFRLARNLPKSQ